MWRTQPHIVAGQCLLDQPAFYNTALPTFDPTFGLFGTCMVSQENGVAMALDCEISVSAIQVTAFVEMLGQRLKTFKEG